MTDLGEIEPDSGRNDKPPKRHWEATRKERFVDLKFSHYLEILLTLALVGIAYLQYTVYTRQAGIMQAQADIADTQNRLTTENSRAFIVFKDISYVKGEPTAGVGGRDFVMTIKNVGKHVAIVTRMDVIPFYGVVKKKLADTPQYFNPIELIVPPIAPDSDVTINAHIANARNVATDAPPIDSESLVKGMADGTIPAWIYGHIYYETGYQGVTGELGFCSKFVPPNERAITPFTFLTCEYPKYTYVH